MYEIFVYDPIHEAKVVFRAFPVGGGVYGLADCCKRGLEACGVVTSASFDPGKARLVESPGQQDGLGDWDELQRAVQELQDQSAELIAQAELVRAIAHGE